MNAVAPRRARGLTAVMAVRKEPLDLDDFPTSPWPVRALFKHILAGVAHVGERVWEPACGRGHMARTIAESGFRVWASDVADYGARYPVHDFLADDRPAFLDARPDWVITNPPFRKAEAFAHRALGYKPRRGIALFVRLQFVEGCGRHSRLFSQHPPEMVAAFAERVTLFRGRLPRPDDGSSATSYCWVVWRRDWPPRFLPTAFHWIPKCRSDLERPDDFE